MLDPEIPYVMYGATNDNSASTRNVQFHASDRDRLSPDTVLIQVYDEAQQQWSDTVVSFDDFQHRAEALCD